jgi:hypothetical protein
MRGMEGNQHAEDADMWVTESCLINDHRPEERLVLANQAQAQATLALAFEQRTANLIAWHAFVERQGDLPDETADLAARILERMGLE